MLRCCKLARVNSIFAEEAKEYAASIREILSSRLTGLDSEVIISKKVRNFFYIAEIIMTRKVHVIKIIRQIYKGHLQVREAFCKALVILRNRKIIDSLDVMDLFFTLIPCEDKNLR